MLTFWNFGYSRINDPGFLELTDIYVASYGLGLRASVIDYFQTSVDFGWQLKDIESTAGSRWFHVNLTMVF